MKLLKDLIFIKSLSGEEEELAQFILSYCQKLGIKASEIEGNVVFHFEGQKRKKALIFCAHLDTVGEGNRDRWTFSPYGTGSGREINGKIYGLGASDDKAGIAAFLSLALILKKEKPVVDVFFVFVTNEEIDGSGSSSFVSYFSKKYLSSYKNVTAIIGEPTNLKKVEIGNRGNYFLKIITSIIQDMDPSLL